MTYASHDENAMLVGVSCWHYLGSDLSINQTGRLFGVCFLNVWVIIIVGLSSFFLDLFAKMNEHRTRVMQDLSIGTDDL